MNKQQIQQFVHQYLEATGCTILEKSPVHVKVKLSPDADKDLTNRPYYWNFVERTGAEPETMTFTFVFDEEAFETSQSNAPPSGGQRIRAAGSHASASRAQPGSAQSNPVQSVHSPAGPAQTGASTQQTAQTSDSILSRYLGIVPAAQRTLHETLHYGSSRLQQMIRMVKQKGKFVLLFEEPNDSIHPVTQTKEYTSWLGANYKVEYACDMKRSELYSLGISLSTGEIVTNFQEILNRKRLTPRLPARTHLKETISIARAVQQLERYIEAEIFKQDHSWSYEAKERMEEEKERIESYYKEMLDRVESEEKDEVAAEYENRLQEIEWQYQPHITASVINCGIFNLFEDTLRQK